MVKNTDDKNMITPKSGDMVGRMTLEYAPTNTMITPTTVVIASGMLIFGLLFQSTCSSGLRKSSAIGFYLP
jgi:hypothetical protein